MKKIVHRQVVVYEQDQDGLLTSRRQLALPERIKSAIDGFMGRSDNPGNRPPTSLRIDEDMPDWAWWFINRAFYLTDKQLGHVNAFKLDPMVNAVTTDLQEDVAGLPRQVKLGSGEAQKVVARRPRRNPADLYQARPEDLADLLNAANPLTTGRGLIVETVGSLIINGNAFWFLQHFGSNPVPQELWNLPGHLVRVVPGINRSIAGIEYNRGGTGQWEFIPTLDSSKRLQFLHFKRFNPQDEPIGLGVLESLQDVYLARYYAFQWVKNFFLRGGTMAGVWTPTNENKVYSDEQMKDWVDKMSRRHLGYDKAFLPHIVQGLKWTQQGMKMSEMELDKHLNSMNAEIIRAAGIPPVMLGIKEGGGLSDAGAATDIRNYWHRTIPRYTSAIDDVLTERLCPLFGKDLAVETDYSQVLVIQSDRLEQAQAHGALVSAGIETTNEARHAIGLRKDTDPESDTLRLPSQAGPLVQLPGTGAGKKADTPLIRRVGEGGGADRLRLALAGRTIPLARPAPDDPVEMARTARWMRHVPLIETTQAKLERLIRGRVESQRRAVKARLQAQHERQVGLAEKIPSDPPFNGPIDFTDLMPDATDADRARVRRILERLLTERGQQAVDELVDQVGEGAAVEVAMNTARASAFLDAQVGRAIDVPDQTTADALRESLSDGVALGESLGELRARVDEVFDGRRDNALTIARTEVMPSYNWAALEGWRQTGVVDETEWVSARDDAVREAHAEADGQIQSLGDSFEVGGEELAYPGDPDGSPENVIACRCVLEAKIDQNAVAAMRLDRWLAAPAPSKNGHARPPKNRIRQLVKR